MTEWVTGLSRLPLKAFRKGSYWKMKGLNARGKRKWMNQSNEREQYFRNSDRIEGRKNESKRKKERKKKERKKENGKERRKKVQKKTDESKDKMNERKRKYRKERKEIKEKKLEGRKEGWFCSSFLTFIFLFHFSPPAIVCLIGGGRDFLILLSLLFF